VIDLHAQAAASSSSQPLPPHPDLSDQDRQTLGLGVGTVAEGLVAAKAARLHPTTPSGGNFSTPKARKGSEERLRRVREEDPDLAAIDGRMRTLYVKRKIGARTFADILDGSGALMSFRRPPMTSSEVSGLRGILWGVGFASGCPNKRRFCFVW
jgi:hypothetical protein